MFVEELQGPSDNEVVDKHSGDKHAVEEVQNPVEPENIQQEEAVDPGKIGKNKVDEAGN